MRTWLCTKCCLATLHTIIEGTSNKLKLDAIFYNNAKNGVDIYLIKLHHIPISYAEPLQFT